MSEPQVVEQIDPRTLLTNLNIREAKADKDLIASIKDLGVLQPIIAYRTVGGDIRVRLGNKRTLCAIEAGRATVPVIVAAVEAEGNKAEVERILGQWAENTHREGLTTAEQVGVVQDLLDLGLSATQVQRRTRMPKATVTAAQAVGGSDAAKTATVEHGLTLDQAAAIAEFDGDEEAVGLLTEAAESGGFKHRLQQLRDARTLREAIAAKLAELEAAGIRATAERPQSDQQLYNLLDADGSRIDEEAHKDCPGHTAYVGPAGYWEETDVDVDYFCADPNGNGHKPVNRSSSRSGGGMSDKDKQERRETVANNKLWRSSTTVRRAWLKEFLARKKAPDEAMWVIITALVDGGNTLRRQMERGHAASRELLGVAESSNHYGADRVGPIMDALNTASDSRVLVIALGVVLSAYEDGTYQDMWRNPASHADAAAYFNLLAGWGYTLSEIEQKIVDAVNAKAEAAA